MATSPSLLNYSIIQAGEGRFIKAWNRGVPFEDQAIEQMKNTARMPFVFKWVAAMPDAHWGNGSTVGTVLPTKGAIIPAAVGVDIGCGMMAVQSNLSRTDMERVDLPSLRAQIEKRVPSGRTNNGGGGDRGAWHDIPEHISQMWKEKFEADYQHLTTKHPDAKARSTVKQLGTLGGGNHFIELCYDEGDMVWVVLHSGSRGLGNRIGTYFTGVAKRMCSDVALPDPELAYLTEGTDQFEDYLFAVHLAQRFAWANRTKMMDAVGDAIKVFWDENEMLLGFTNEVHCHHNYIALEQHFGETILVTRKGAVRAQENDLGIIPGSMGARTYIVRGLGNKDSFSSCSHGAGRAMGRNAAMKKFSVEEHALATAGVECDKTKATLDETPGAYKDIEAVMAAQTDLVTPVYRLKQFLCVKGVSDQRR